MPINFTALFQDSWNFIRNQQTAVSRFLFIYTLYSLISYFLNSHFFFNENETVASSEQHLQHLVTSDVLYFSVLQQAVMLLLNTWVILSVHQISKNSRFNLSQSFSQALGKFFGVVTLNLLLILPIAIIMLDIISAILSSRSPSSFAFPGIIIGIFVFIRLFLAPISFLLGEQPWSKSIGFIWQNGKKRTGTLFIFCLITQFIFGLIAQQLNLLASNSFLALISSILLAGLNIFSLILTYRFYTLFTQKAS